MSQPVETRELRNFAFLVGGIFLCISLWPVVWRGDSLRWWALVPAITLIPFGIIAPRLLAPIYRSWMAVGHALGWVNTRLLLSLLYYGLIAPMGIVMRLMGRDSMRRQYVRDTDSYCVVRRRRDPSHMRNMF